MTTYDRDINHRADNHAAHVKKIKEELLAKVRCDDEEFQEIFKNNSTSLRPLIQFFKFLVPKPSTISDQPNQITKYVQSHARIVDTVVGLVHASENDRN